MPDTASTGPQQEPLMERRTASVYPQALPDIFHRFPHSRRDFLVRVGKITASGITAAALFESPLLNQAQAQQALTRGPAIPVGERQIGRANAIDIGDVAAHNG